MFIPHDVQYLVHCDAGRYYLLNDCGDTVITTDPTLTADVPHFRGNICLRYGVVVVVIYYPFIILLTIILLFVTSVYIFYCWNDQWPCTSVLCGCTNWLCIDPIYSVWYCRNICVAVYCIILLFAIVTFVFLSIPYYQCNTLATVYYHCITLKYSLQPLLYCCKPFW